MFEIRKFVRTYNKWMTPNNAQILLKYHLLCKTVARAFCAAADLTHLNCNPAHVVLVHCALRSTTDFGF